MMERRTRGTKGPRLSQEPDAATLKRRHEAVLADGINTDDSFTTRVISASASRWVPEPKNEHGLGYLKVEAEISVSDASEGYPVMIILKRHRHPSGEHKTNARVQDGFLADEVELLAAALTKAARLGREQGILNDVPQEVLDDLRAKHAALVKKHASAAA